MKHLELVIFILLYSIFNNVIGQSDENTSESMSILGLAIEALRPCPDDFILMVREIGRRPSEENYWNGIIDINAFKDLPEARIELQLDNPAVVTIDEDLGRIYSEGMIFRITLFTPLNNRTDFNVKGSRGRPYPNIVKVKLNEQTVCKNPVKVKPTILGTKPVALGSFNTKSEDFIPYCGRKQIDYTELIIRSEVTSPGDWPWHIALYRLKKNENKRTYRCGGSLISRTTVITAGHCVTRPNGKMFPAHQLLVVAGKYNLKEIDSFTQESIVSRILVNHYDFTSLRNDIAILHLKNEITFNQYVQPICLWTDYYEDRDTSKDSVYGLNGTVVGWGLNENDTASERLTSVSLNIVSDTDCLLSYASFFERFVYDKSLCAGNTDGGSPCNGDSGGGLAIPIIQSDGKISYFLRGIVSVTVSRPDKRICDSNHYTVFTDVVQFLNWIKTNK